MWRGKTPKALHAEENEVHYVMHWWRLDCMIALAFACTACLHKHLKELFFHFSSQWQPNKKKRI